MCLNGERITVAAEDPHSSDAEMLIWELSVSLKVITGDSGQSSFHMEDLCDSRALFAIARNHKGEAIGCGALRPMDENIGEIKRMYARPNTSGVGSRLLLFLEQQARSLGYGALRLETRRKNIRAVSFYERNGYQQAENYGRYIGREEAVCFEKQLFPHQI